MFLQVSRHRKLPLSTIHPPPPHTPLSTPSLRIAAVPLRHITMTTTAWTGRTPLDEVDPEIRALIRDEKNRQVTGLELIASEVIFMISFHFHSPNMTFSHHHNDILPHLMQLNSPAPCPILTYLIFPPTSHSPTSHPSTLHPPTSHSPTSQPPTSHLFSRSLH